ncbi:HAD-IA family hydrolase [Marinicrinis sediminis]|uniref:HAD-IA family hydrolase n=1 Tax=Marinicrinis sediminis TaxID=1652465 RepID=A0ABW5R6Q9_9BACL
MNVQQALTTYKAVFLDAGDTLVTVPEAQETVQKYLAEKQFTAQPKQIEAFFREAFDRFYYQKELDAEAVCSPESDRTYWIGIYDYVLAQLGAQDKLQEDEIHRCCHELYDLFVSPSQYVLFPDVKPALAQLQQRGYKIGLISNFAPTLRAILEEKGILSYFDPVLVSTEVGIEKPNPRIFQMALEQSGLQSSDVLYIGDHEINDIWSPNQVGIDAVKIIRYPYQTEQGDGTKKGEHIHSLLDLFEPGGKLFDHEYEA